jgi:nucleotide-binding universal stress UspA family protein
MAGPILVGCDDSEHAEDALELGRLLERVTGGELVACHAGAGASPSHVLHERAEQLGARLIVLGATHRGRGVRRLLEGTSQQVLEGAPCPVAVAPEGFARQHPGLPRQIAVGYDRSPESRRALELAAALARATGARLRLVRAVDVTFAVAPPLDAAAYQEMARAVREGAREGLDDALEGLRDLRAEGAVLEGDAGEVLVEDSAASDLLVVGSRGRGPLRRVLLGSTSSRVLHDAACPVVIVPRGGESY